MSIIQGNALGSTAAYQIANSLRFRSAASAYLSRTFGTPTGASIFTYSTFVKRGSLGGTFRLLGASTTTYLTFNSSDQINLTLNGVSAATSTAVFRDPSAHYHVVYQQNGASQTIWVNNVSVATGTTAAAIFNTAIVHQIGAANTSNFLDGYLSEINFIDGQALTPSSFGEFSAEHGQWVPKKYTGAYGNNGFYLPFNDGSNLTNLCLDRSGNANNWTANNFSLTSGVTYDWMIDSPTNGASGTQPVGNYSVMNPLDNYSCTISQGNLYVSSGGAYTVCRNSVPFNTGKRYWEVTYISGANSQGFIGVSDATVAVTSSSWNTANGWFYDGFNGNKYTSGSGSAYGATYTANDVIGVAVDADAGSITFYKNGVSQGVAFSGLTGKTFAASVSDAGDGPHVYAMNFGQRPFAYTPPAGFKALCTKNLPTPSILNPKQHFDIALATGANIKTTSEAVFPSNFFEWIKDRANVNNHQLIDTVRGSSAVLQSNTTAAETTYSIPAGNSVGWVWKAGGAAVSNTVGSITSQVSANTTAGFSIVTYTGTGANATVGHGLGVVPKLILIKQRSVGATENWAVYNANLANTEYLLLNTTAAKTTGATYWNSTAPTSSVFSIGTAVDTNESTKSFVAYCFAEIPGFSKIGSYTGNGLADGPFVYCEFKPRFVMIKRTDTTGNWIIKDTVRSAYNAGLQSLYPNLSNAEGASETWDAVSNGFKPRSTSADINANTGTYIYIAFAEAPFNYSIGR